VRNDSSGGSPTLFYLALFFGFSVYHYFGPYIFVGMVYPDLYGDTIAGQIEKAGISGSPCIVGRIP